MTVKGQNISLSMKKTLLEMESNIDELKLADINEKFPIFLYKGRRA